MRSVEPEVFLVARPKVDYEAMAAYLREVGGERWLERLDRDQLGNDAQDLAEFAGKMCYRSWEPGLNPNVRKVRDDQEAYLQNILQAGARLGARARQLHLRAAQRISRLHT